MTDVLKNCRKRLPDFNDRADYMKSSNIEESEVTDYSGSRRFMPLIEGYIKEGQAEARDLRILDFGCGRGLLVAYLRAQGFDAYGVDISEEYIATSREYFARKCGNETVLSLVGANSETSFDDGYFDIILSNQVLEHVENLEHVANEFSRLLKPGGVALHILPPRWNLIEPHMKIPFAHWFPKRNIRRIAIGLFLLIGIGHNYFAEFSLRDRSTIFYRYSTDQTFYRSNSEIVRCFEHFGMGCEISEAVRAHLVYKLGPRWGLLLRVPIFQHLLIAGYANFWALFIFCRRGVSELNTGGESS